jgi:hypothetical protein
LRDGIDGQIAACKIFLERDLGPKLNREPAIAGRYFPLATRQCIFFVGIRVQEHGKIAADLAIFQTQQFVLGTSYDHPIAFLDGQAKQSVANGAANQIHLHA